MATWQQNINAGGFLGGIGQANVNAPQASDVNSTLALIRQNNEAQRAGANNVGLQALQGIGGLKQSLAQNKLQETQAAFNQAHANAWKSGDTSALRDFAVQNPAFVEQAQKAVSGLGESQRSDIGNLAAGMRVSLAQGPEAFSKFVTSNSGTLGRVGADPNTILQMGISNPQAAQQFVDTIGMSSLGGKDYFDAIDKRQGRAIDRDKIAVDRERLAETERSNRAGEAAQWANVGIAQQNANIRKAELQGKAIDAQIARETNQVKLAELQDRRAQNQREIEQAKNEKTNSVAGNLFDIGRAITVGNELGALVNEHPTAVSRNQGGLLGWAPNIADDTRTLAAKTDEYNLKVVLPALRGTFGGNPTEGERQALMQSSNNLKKATSNKDFLNELNRTQDTLIQMQKRQIRGLGVPVTRSSDEATDTQMLLSDPSLVKEYITTHGYLPEAYYKAQFSDGK